MIVQNYKNIADMLFLLHSKKNVKKEKFINNLYVKKNYVIVKCNLFRKKTTSHGATLM